jgi:hypothetical protein
LTNYILSDQTRDNITDNYKVIDNNNNNDNRRTPNFKEFECKCGGIINDNNNNNNNQFEIIPCGNISCIIPHILIYKTDKLLRSTNNRTNHDLDQYSDVMLEVIENLESEW